ncbi:GAF domain-containing protein [Rheinheimera fenheensis]|uniref:GAF domain-containing protein n=1 Tax=Rheinheimera fenheensis TaxID=3152295 RepID=UPI00325EF105
MMNKVTIDDIRNCLEGLVPSALSTCSPEGVPNVSMISQALYVDSSHVALSFQFFNKTRENIILNPFANLLVMDPQTSARYRLDLRYIATHTSGPIFERMKAKLAGIASHEGMQNVFRLKGSDIYRVEKIEHVQGHELPVENQNSSLLPAMQRTITAIDKYLNQENLIDVLLSNLQSQFGIQHCMFLIADNHARKLYMLGSMGYKSSGVGSEIPFGCGVIGVAAETKVPIRIMFASSEYSYGRQLEDRESKTNIVDLESRIAYPGLEMPESQLAVPLISNGTLLGVLYMESLQQAVFGYDIEDVLQAICSKVADSMKLLQFADGTQTSEDLDRIDEIKSEQPHITVSYHKRDHSIFINDVYLIKGVAGAILWHLLNAYTHRKQTEFSNKLLRTSANLPLPDITDNLDARLILLSRRLAERCPEISIKKTGRGCFCLNLSTVVVLRLENE